MRNKLFFIIIIFLILNGCGSDTDTDSKDKSKNTKTEIEESDINNQEELSKIVEKMYNYANVYDYDNMKKYFITSTLPSSDIDLKEYINEKTKNGSIENTKILHTEIIGNSAIVRIEKTFSNGETEKLGIELENRSGDEWGIVFNKYSESDYVHY